MLLSFLDMYRVIKNFEKLIHKRPHSFLEMHENLFEMQFGFRTGHSTEHALVSLSEKIKSTPDDGNVGCAIFIDLQKAFDTVNHRILLQKLEHHGISGIALQWFQSYLHNRKQFVSVNGHSSRLSNITCGVPQVSVLGPLLFLIYINEHSGQIFSFVQRSGGVVSHALVRSQFLLILTNQVPSLCLLPRFAAKLRPFLTVLTTIPKKTLHARLCRFPSKFQREKILHTSAHKFFRHRYAIADLWQFENHCSHFCAGNPTKLSKR